jgi:hypothetical protein
MMAKAGPALSMCSLPKDEAMENQPHVSVLYFTLFRFTDVRESLSPEERYMD